MSIGKKILQIGGTILAGTPKGAVAKVAAGLLQGSIEMVPPLATIKNLLDVDGDGKITIKDFQAMDWQTILKMITVFGLSAAAVYYGIVKL